MINNESSPEALTRQPIEVCPRCKGKHVGVDFFALANPGKAGNAYAMCPTLQQPIMTTFEVQVEDDPPPAS